MSWIRKHVESRFYSYPPEKSTLERCEYHGSAHHAYGWGKQMDPRWTHEQRLAYLKGYGLSPEEAEAHLQKCWVGVVVPTAQAS